VCTQFGAKKETPLKRSRDREMMQNGDTDELLLAIPSEIQNCFLDIWIVHI